MRISIENPNLDDPTRQPSPAQSYSVSFVQPEVNYEDYYREMYHALWLELHSTQDANPAWFEYWIKRVPNAQCGCQTWLADYLLANPPRYDDFFAYSVELHNAVSAKLGKEQWTIERAKEHYGFSDRTVTIVRGKSIGSI